MKKTMTLLLALLLIASMSVSVVMAQEPVPESEPAAQEYAPSEEAVPPEGDSLTEDTVPSYEFKRTRPRILPYLPFGTDLSEAAANLRSQLENGGIKIAEDMQQNTITLPNGNQYQVISMSGSNSDNYQAGQIEVKIYAGDTGKVIGALYDISAEQPELLSVFKDAITEVYGEPIPLTSYAFGDLAELIGESVSLENSRDMWRYVYTAHTEIDPTGIEIEPTGNNAGNGILSGNAVLTLINGDGHAYIAEYLDPNALAVSETEKPINAEGFDKLGQNEQIAVRLYSEYLEKQYHDALQAYVNYLLEKNKQ